MKQSQELSIWLPPPQQYELSRLNHAPTFEPLAEFSRWRSRFGATLFYPVPYHAKDRMVHTLPGDDLYPAVPNYEAVASDFEKYKDIPAAELREKATHLHRKEFLSDNTSEGFINMVPKNRHICPEGSNVDSILKDTSQRAKL